MKVFSCDLVDGKMIVDTSIVYQDVEFAESPFDLGKSSRDLFRFGEVALNGCGGAARASVIAVTTRSASVLLEA